MEDIDDLKNIIFSQEVEHISCNPEENRRICLNIEFGGTP